MVINVGLCVGDCVEGPTGQLSPQQQKYCLRPVCLCFIGGIFLALVEGHMMRYPFL